MGVATDRGTNGGSHRTPKGHEYSDPQCIIWTGAGLLSSNFNQIRECSVTQRQSNHVKSTWLALSDTPIALGSGLHTPQEPGISLE
jgi:hypothetical protein